MKDIVQNYTKKFCLMCDECKSLSDNSVSVFFNDSELAPGFYMELTNEYYCKVCGKATFQYDIDPNIAKSVRLLNLHGFKTNFSCQGHDRGELSSIPYIRFEDIDFLLYIKSNPDKEKMIKNAGWKVEVDIQDIDTFCKRNVTDLRYNLEEETDESYKLACDNLYKILLEILIDHDQIGE